MPSDALWDLAKIVLQILLVAGLGAVAYFLKKSLNGICERLASLERLEREGAIDAAAKEGRLREKLAAEYVSRDTCNICHDETRQTTTRIFAKIENLQAGQARLEGMVLSMSSTAGKAFEALAAKATKGGGGD